MSDVVIAVGIVATFLAELAFVGRFLRMPWWRTPEGRMILAKDVVLLLVLGLAVIGTFVPDMPGRNIVRLVVWSAVPVVFWWKTVLFYRRQAEGRRLRRQKEAPPS